MLFRAGPSGYSFVLASNPRKRERQKTGLVKNPQVLDQAGLLFDGPPSNNGPALRLAIRQIQIIPRRQRAVVRCPLPLNIRHVRRCDERKASLFFFSGRQLLTPDRHGEC